MSALPPSGRRVPSPLRAYPSFIAPTDSCAHPLWLSSPSALASFEESLQLAISPCCQRDVPDVISTIFLQMPDPMPRRSHEVHLPVSSFFSFVSSAFPRSRMGRLPASNPRTRLFADRLFEAADIPLCSGLQICSPLRSFPPLRLQPQGGRGFDIRAERASLPPHAPDLLTVRIQAIDGTRTFTSQDSQPCRLLSTSCQFAAGSYFPANPLYTFSHCPRTAFQAYLADS